jgi:hypothetical protein
MVPLVLRDESGVVGQVERQRVARCHGRSAARPFAVRVLRAFISTEILRDTFAVTERLCDLQSRALRRHMAAITRRTALLTIATALVISCGGTPRESTVTLTVSGMT